MNANKHSVIYLKTRELCTDTERINAGHVWGGKLIRVLIKTYGFIDSLFDSGPMLVFNSHVVFSKCQQFTNNTKHFVTQQKQTRF